MKNNYIEIINNSLVFNFGNFNEKFEVNFNRTLRLPDDNKKYNLPPGLGHFPLLHVEDFSNNIPEPWSEHGGIFMPMYQAEAMWMSFKNSSGRPFAVKIASGKVNAVSGKQWSNKLEGGIMFSNERIDTGFASTTTLKPSKKEPDYMVSPTQPWLDGFNVGKGVVRQFVAVPLDSGYTVEEQVTGKAEHGGIQIIVYPMKEEKWQKIKEDRANRARIQAELEGCYLSACASASASSSLGTFAANSVQKKSLLRSAKPDMGLGAGGMMKQDIYDDEYGIDCWDQENGLRVFVHLANSEQYKSITGKNPPTQPLNADIYKQYNYPWFDYYSDSPALSGSDILSKVDSIGSMQIKKGEQILPDNGNTPNLNNPIIQIINKKTVKEGKW